MNLNSPTIEKLNPADINEALQVASTCFPEMALSEFSRFVRDQLDDNFHMCFVVKLNHDIIGGYF